VTRLLLDTHAFLWWLAGDKRLSAGAREAISEELDPIFISAASIWEITTKHRLGKLPGVSAIVDDLAGVIEGQGFVGLPITVRHGETAGALPGPHRDPFDRMLIAQALLDDLVLVSNEQAFGAYGARRLW
jgi:PIN domain nuclease of toxin-antitoxin system